MHVVDIIQVANFQKKKKKKKKREAKSPIFYTFGFVVLSSKKRQVDLGKLFDNSNSGLISLRHGGSCTYDAPLCYDQCMQLGLKHGVLKFFQLLYSSRDPF